MKNIFKALALLVTFLSLSAFPILMSAQGVTKCGSIIEAELVQGSNSHDYTIDLAPGDALNISTEIVGQTLHLVIEIYDPTGTRVLTFEGGDSSYAKNGNSPVFSTRGTYTIRVRGYVSDDLGIYTLYIGCTLRDGTVINPGDTAPVTGSNVASSASAPTFSGTGFPGLAPVDFSSVAKIPMIASVPMTGGVAPTGDTILGYTFDAAVNDNLALSFTRLSGNLNLGFVVLSADNKVVFQASLVTSSELTTKFTLPSSGTYTIGIFRIDLLPPDAPEATAFQLTATLNP